MGMLIARHRKPEVVKKSSEKAEVSEQKETTKTKDKILPKAKSKLQEPVKAPQE